jgi:two-component system CheB/CheR fusion protein
MPEEDGCSFIRRVRARSERNIPALALTALASDADRQRTLSAGFQMHLTKPADIELITAAVAKLSGRAMPVRNTRLD